MPMEKIAGSLTGNYCETGGFCECASKFPHPCTAGTYNSLTGQEDRTNCGDCDAGSYCTGEADLTRTDVPEDITPYLASSSVTGNCEAGYFCIAGSYDPR